MSADSKDPDEIITVTFPFAGELGVATLDAVDYVTITVIKGNDPSAGAMLNGAASIASADVLQSVRNGVDGNDYKLRCRAVLSDGRKLVRAIDLPVRAR
jgi:hypothetical protein